jgi:hypothetical protein
MRKATRNDAIEVTAKPAARNSVAARRGRARNRNFMADSPTNEVKRPPALYFGRI